MQAKIFEVYDKLNPTVGEAFKVLRTNILFSCPEKKIKTLAIVSCNPKEGRTTVSINLAISIAKSGMRVLLVDADLRKPMLIKRLGGSDLVGLSSYLIGATSLTEVICDTSIDNLNYISCGPKPTNPSEIIGSAEFATFLETVEQMYDMVIIDTSPLGSVIDSAIIASHTDGTIMVIACRAASKSKVKRLKEQLENANARILGVTLNKVSKRDYQLYSSLYSSLHYYNKTGELNKQGGAAKFKNWKFKKADEKEVTHSD